MVARRLNLILLNSRRNFKKHLDRYNLFLGKNYSFLLRKYNKFLTLRFNIFSIFNSKLKLFYYYGVSQEILKLNFFYFMLKLIFDLYFFNILKKDNKFYRKVYNYVCDINELARIIYTLKELLNILKRALKFLKKNIFIKHFFLRTIQAYPEYIYLYIYLLLNKGFKVMQLKFFLNAFFRRKEFKNLQYKVKIKGVLTFRARRKTKLIVSNIISYKTSGIKINKYGFFYKNSYITYKSKIGIKIYLNHIKDTYIV
eukprot:GHVN01048573.1.p1 GENE.GHVN01048573.1~~GHVN01048573.1.p1  ORF type:complete len:255 (-),score=-17.92 GHVN01048573.1:408-1172(-)